MTTRTPKDMVADAAGTFRSLAREFAVDNSSAVQAALADLDALANHSVLLSLTDEEFQLAGHDVQNGFKPFSAGFQEARESLLAKLGRVSS